MTRYELIVALSNEGFVCELTNGNLFVTLSRSPIATISERYTNNFDTSIADEGEITPKAFKAMSDYSATPIKERGYTDKIRLRLSSNLFEKPRYLGKRPSGGYGLTTMDEPLKLLELWFTRKEVQAMDITFEAFEEEDYDRYN